MAFTTTDSTLWVVQSDGNPVQLDLGVDGGNFYLNQMGFLPDGTLVAVPSGGRVFLCREIFCFMMWMPKR